MLHDSTNMNNYFLTVGLFLFSFLCVLGSATFAAGVFFKGTSAMLPVMLIGRLLFGSGNGSLTSKFHRSCRLISVLPCQQTVDVTYFKILKII